MGSNLNLIWIGKCIPGILTAVVIAEMDFDNAASNLIDYVIPFQKQHGSCMSFVF